MKFATVGIAIALAFSGVACIRARNYHPAGTPSVFHYAYPANASPTQSPYGCGYFEGGQAWLAFIEFDARGSQYRTQTNETAQLDAALKLIRDRRAASPNREIALYVFVHGWKNNASEQSGNVWGFRRLLSTVAANSCGRDAVGIYIGWPGASLKGDKFLSFWNREPVADNVGNGELADVLRKILQATKDRDYSGKSQAVVIGHSFGGIVLERAATRLLREQLSVLNAKTAEPGDDVAAFSPADLFVLVNEAGAAAIARPFLLDLKQHNIRYEDKDGHARPLLLSITSEGDLATKVAYPGGEFFSTSNRSASETWSKPDAFGQASSTPWDLLTAANMVALRSHEIERKTPSRTCEIAITLRDNLIDCRAPGKQAKSTPPPAVQYCMNKVQENRLNDTPYWIMQMPQIFVPDHSSVFQAHLIDLLRDVARLNFPDCTPPPPVGRVESMEVPLAPPPPPRPAPEVHGRPVLKRAAPDNQGARP